MDGEKQVGKQCLAIQWHTQKIHKSLVDMEHALIPWEVLNSMWLSALLIWALAEKYVCCECQTSVIK